TAGRHRVLFSAGRAEAVEANEVGLAAGQLYCERLGLSWTRPVLAVQDVRGIAGRVDAQHDIEGILLWRRGDQVLPVFRRGEREYHVGRDGRVAHGAVLPALRRDIVVGASVAGIARCGVVQGDFPRRRARVSLSRLDVTRAAGAAVAVRTA